MRILLYLIILTFALPCSADIYKWVDDEGNVSFSDRPDKGQKKQKIAPLPMSTYKSSYKKPEKEVSVTNKPDKQAKEEKKKPTRYSKLAITQPQNDAAIRSNSGQLTISLKTEPKLDIEAGHKIQISVDGTKTTTSDKSNITLQNLDRGTHTVTAKIVDKKGKMLKSSSKHTFHLLRKSIR